MGLILRLLIVLAVNAGAAALIGHLDRRDPGEALYSFAFLPIGEVQSAGFAELEVAHALGDGDPDPDAAAVSFSWPRLENGLGRFHAIGNPAVIGPFGPSPPHSTGPPTKV